MPDQYESEIPNDQRQGNTGITDFEKQNQAAALEARYDAREHPGALGTVKNSVESATPAMGGGLQDIRNKFHDVTKQGTASDDEPGKLSNEDSQSNPGQTVPTKVMREGAAEEKGADLNKGAEGNKRQ